MEVKVQPPKFWLVFSGEHYWSHLYSNEVEAAAFCASLDSFPNNDVLVYEVRLSVKGGETVTPSHIERTTAKAGGVRIDKSKWTAYQEAVAEDREEKDKSRRKKSPITKKARAPRK